MVYELRIYHMHPGRNFDAFANDPRWIEAKKHSEQDGLIVANIEKYLMQRVPYSPVARASDTQQ